MNFDLQRFSDGKVFIRHNCTKYGFTVSDTGVSAPRLAIRHNDKNYYAALTSSADKPRLAVRTGGETKYIGLSPKGKIVWLTFDESATADKCGNTWTTYGTPTIEDDTNAISGKSLHLDGSSYLQLDGSVKLGGQDFTIDGWVTMDSSAANNDRIFQFATSKANQGTSGFIALVRASATTLKMYLPSKNGTTSTLTLTNRFHFAIVYQHATSSTAVYINGVKKLTLSSSLAATNWTFVYIGDTGSGSRCWNGSIEQFRIWQGVAVWTSNFAPPAYSSYFADYLTVWLPFTSSPTEDKCGNTWTAYGSPSIEDDTNAISGKSLHLDGASYLQLDGSVKLGGQDFTVDFWATLSNTEEYWNCGIAFIDCDNGSGYWHLDFAADPEDYIYGAFAYYPPPQKYTRSEVFSSGNECGRRIHVEFVYEHEDEFSYSNFYVFVNGVCIAKKQNEYISYINAFRAKTVSFCIGAPVSVSADPMIGSLEHFRVFDGVALHTTDFTPPTAGDDYV